MASVVQRGFKKSQFADHGHSYTGIQFVFEDNQQPSFKQQKFSVVSYQSQTISKGGPSEGCVAEVNRSEIKLDHT